MFLLYIEKILGRLDNIDEIDFDACFLDFIVVNQNMLLRYVTSMKILPEIHLARVRLPKSGTKKAHEVIRSN